MQCWAYRRKLVEDTRKREKKKFEKHHRSMSPNDDLSDRPVFLNAPKNLWWMNRPCVDTNTACITIIISCWLAFEKEKRLENTFQCLHLNHAHPHFIFFDFTLNVRRSQANVKQFLKGFLRSDTKNDQTLTATSQYILIFWFIRIECVRSS